MTDEEKAQVSRRKLAKARGAYVEALVDTLTEDRGDKYDDACAKVEAQLRVAEARAIADAKRVLG